jgi:hypothetical protein
MIQITSRQCNRAAKAGSNRRRMPLALIDAAVMLSAPASNR